MAAKHDGKKARANHWVMQQNLAKQKGGRPGYQFTEKKPPKAGANAKKDAVPARSKPADADSSTTAPPEPTAPAPTDTDE